MEDEFILIAFLLDFEDSWLSRKPIVVSTTVQILFHIDQTSCSTFCFGFSYKLNVARWLAALRFTRLLLEW